MKNKIKVTLATLCWIMGFSALSQEYNYLVDLTKVQNDQLEVVLSTPKIDEKEIVFWMPKIIPGTYMESNYGKYISRLSALDKKGRNLPVTRLSDNSWKIEKADKLSKLKYIVDDIFDAENEDNIFMMAASNIEEGSNYVIHPPAFFGYFEGMKNLPFKLEIKKPENFYGSTGLIPVDVSKEKDVYLTRDYDELVDSPLMYNVPDTTFINVGNVKVLVSVYSPKKMVTSTYIADKYKKMLKAQEEYLGNQLPVEKYAFILYFADPAKATPQQGALEHGVSSFYYFSEAPQETVAPYLVDVGAHEFFHIITPLTIHSKEIEDFNYNEPDLSQHLWLYEGVTEYASDHIQVRSGLISPDEFLSKLAGKISISQANYDDKLAFTELSENAAGKHADQYPNVYEKGALIAAMLDINLIKLSNGRKDLQDVILALGKKFGKNKPFEDSKLFNHIEEMTYPEIGTFLKTYVGGSQQIPYNEILKHVGVILNKEPDKRLATIGKVGLGYNPERQMVEVIHTTQLNEFGKKMGYKRGDLLLTWNGEPISPPLFGKLLQDFSVNTKENEQVEVKVLRKIDDGTEKEIILSAPAVIVSAPGKTTLTMNPDANAEQIKNRAIWLQANPIIVAPEDVKSVDAVVNALYDVLSGSAGPRNWDRFFSLFKPGAKMGAMVPSPNGNMVLMRFSPEEYKTMNAPHFMKDDFFEEEIGRREQFFGEIAHVWSAYKYRSGNQNVPHVRGINSIQLIYDENRWWITDLLWNGEREGNKISKELLSGE